MEHLFFTEKYRPKRVEDCILPDAIKNTFLGFVSRKEIPNLILSGSPGLGKTTVARAMCEEVGCDYLFINGSDESGIDMFRIKIKNYATSVSLMGGRKVIIIDEADKLTPQAQDALRGGIEEVSLNCSFIFTCNHKNRISEAIQSRCTSIDFKVNGSKAKIASQFFKRVEWILTQENIPFDKEVVAAIITKHFPDNRRVLNELQRYAATGAIDKGILANVVDIQIGELVNALKTKNFAAAKKWVTYNLDNDISKIFRKLYDSLYEELNPNFVPQMVILIAKYQYQAAFVADDEINLLACLTEIMVECPFK